MIFNRSLVQGRRWRVALLILALIGTLWPVVASAHAFLDTSTPTANAVVAKPPAEVTMTFTERIQPGSSRAELYNSDAVKVDTPASHIGSDPHQLVLPLPANLAAGTYTVQWQNVSAEDGHPNNGYFAFTIGGQADVVLPAPPPAPPTTGIVSLSSISRWLGLLGLAGLIGSLLTWRWVVAPSLSDVDEGARRRITHRVRALSLGSAVLALIGSGLLLIDHLQTSGNLSIGALGSTLVETRFGLLLLTRVILIVALGWLAWLPGLWAVPASTPVRRLVLLLCALAPVPYALNSHAAALGEGGAAAVTADWIHLTAASLWIGGVLAMALGLSTVRAIGAEQRRAMLAEAIPRFSTLAIISVIILGLTGFYAAWLEVGNINALLHTTYGHTLIVKLLLLVPLLLLGAINLLVVGPRMRSNVRQVRHFGQTIVAEAILGVAVLAVVGALIALPTGREVLTFTSGHPTFRFEQGGMRAVLQIYPGTVGLNRYTADVQPANGSLPNDTQVFLRVSSSGQVSGQQQITLAREPGSKGRFSAQGSELSVVGTWNIDLVVRQPNQPDWDASSDVRITRTPPAETAPGLPLRFLGTAPIFGFITLTAGIVALVIGLRRKRVKAERQFTLESAAGLLLVGTIVLVITRAPGLPASTGNPAPKTPESIAAGKALYLQNCVVCHGADGHGDGPLASQLNPPPADLYAAHVDYHTDKQLFDWIKHGINGSAMPGFKDKMTDQQIWNVVNYVRSLRHPE